MTYLEKAVELNPGCDSVEFIVAKCPDHVFKDAYCLCEVEGHGLVCERCPVCWGMEYKGEEVKV